MQQNFPADRQTGKLFLIGAGPGDPELLTLKAARVLGECDVILYDRLVNKSILRYARTGAELVYVGKHEGEQQPVQTRIFALILEHALAGKVVGRLKGGDPLIFARGGEEWALAQEHGIPVEFVPGVSSALAVPGLAGIPLTLREASRGFAIITGHCPTEDAAYWKRYAGVDTLVILMGVKTRQLIARALIDAGRFAQQPAAFIHNGSLANEEVIETTLEAVAAGRVEVSSPAVFVIGDVVGLRQHPEKRST